MAISRVRNSGLALETEILYLYLQFVNKPHCTHLNLQNPLDARPLHSDASQAGAPCDIHRRHVRDFRFLPISLPRSPFLRFVGLLHAVRGAPPKEVSPTTGGDIVWLVTVVWSSRDVVGGTWTNDLQAAPIHKIVSIYVYMYMYTYTYN